MLDRASLPPSSLRAVAPAPLPVSEMMRGKPVEEVVDLMPRLFNLCRHAQSIAVRMAAGMDVSDCDALAGEIRDDHILRLAVFLPIRLGQKPLVVDRTDHKTLGTSLFGAPEFAQSSTHFDAFLELELGLAPVLRAVRDAFAPAEACANPLPKARDADLMRGVPLENSVAMRHDQNPVLKTIETAYGRGPFWRATARAIDLHALLHGQVPMPRLLAPGTAVAPTARGDYAIRIRTEAGKVMGINRVTPTDHMLMPGGALQLALATLPQTKRGLAGLVTDVFDPCVQVRLEGGVHA